MVNVKGQITADLGIVDILVNNAGLMPKASLREGHASDIQRVLDVNVSAHFWVYYLVMSCLDGLHLHCIGFFCEDGTLDKRRLYRSAAIVAHFFKYTETGFFFISNSFFPVSCIFHTELLDGALPSSVDNSSFHRRHDHP